MSAESVPLLDSSGVLGKPEPQLERAKCGAVVASRGECGELSWLCRGLSPGVGLGGRCTVYGCGAGAS